MKKNYPNLLVLSMLLLTCLFSTKTFSQSFAQSELDFNGLGDVSNGVTSLMYGPDGRLYVAEYPGLIKILTIARNSSTEYQVTSMEVLDGIQTMPDHNDDGTTFFSTERETTGLTVAGTASNPVIYVSSSDFRIGAGEGGGNGDTGLDTNSGVITRFTWNGTAWEVVDLVRGLPRSEENHATNGLEFATINGTDYLIVASGGITNGGSPSTNFVYTCEYALSGAILSINLDMLESMPVLNNNGRSYIYDLPTLDDPTRPNVNGITDPDTPGYNGIDVNDPWGGNDGLNQAMIVPGGPVQIYSPGYRNAYDIVLTESGALYATDNGANQGWGGFPENEGTGNVTNNYLPSEPGSQSVSDGEYIDNVDHLQLITTDVQSYTAGSYYGGHPNPTRANPNGAGLFTAPASSGLVGAVFRTQIYDPDGSTPGSTTDPSLGLPANWPPVQSANAVEGDWRGPSVYNPDFGEVQDNNVVTWGTNTNGIDEYTASNFGGAMQGNLLAGHSGGNVRRVELNGSGMLDQMTPNFLSGIGGDALGITCNGDNQIFPGSIWTGTLGGNIVVFEPQDFIDCIEPGQPGYDPLADGDFDGYSNQDEEDNGTQICNGGSQPDDFDKSAGAPFISDLNDPDDDNDGISDALDPFQLGDPNDSGSDAFTLPVFNDLFNYQQGLGGIFGLGLTGLMNNGDTGANWLNWLDDRDNGPNPNDVLGGAPGIMTSHMTDGTALGASNDQDKGYQYGVQVDNTTGEFTVIGGMNGFTGPLRLYENTNGVTNGELGFFIGDGTQSNYIKFVVTTDGFTALQELNDVPGTPVNVTIPVGNRPAEGIRFYFVVDPAAGTVALEYQIDSNGRTLLTTFNAAGTILQAIQTNTTDLAVGFIGTSNTPGVELEGSWDFLNVLGEVPILTQEIPDLDRIIDNADEDIDLNNYFDDDDGVGNLTYTIENETNTNIATSITDNILTISYPSTIEASTITVRATDGDGFFVEDTFTVDVTDGFLVLYRVNAGGPLLTSIDGDIDWAEDTVANNSQYLSSAGSNSVYSGTVSSTDSSVNTTTTPTAIYATERFDNAPGNPYLTYSFPVSQSGNYEVRLYMGNGFSGTANEGDRVFDVTIEGASLPLLNNLDLSGTYGHNVGTMISHIIYVNDGYLDVQFLHDLAENPLVNAIEILDVPDTETPMYLHPIADQTNNGGEQLTGNLGVQVIGGDGNLQYSATGLPPGVFIEPTNGQIGGTIEESAIASSPFNVTITVDDSDGLTGDQVTTSFAWNVIEPFAYRINAGGVEISSTNIGPDWEDNANPGAQSGGNYFVNTGVIEDFGGITFDTKDISIPAYIDQATFDGIFAEERYDVATGDEMEFTFSVNNGDYVVNFYLGNSFNGSDAIGDRVFDILLEGIVVENDLDLIERFGHQVGGMLSYPVTVSDGELNISFGHVTENPLVNAIEVFVDDPSNPLILSGIADQANEINNTINITASASGGDAGEQVSYYLSGHPAGVSIDETTGQITGNISPAAANGGPANDGVYNVVVTAMKPLSAPSTQTFTWTITSEFLWTDKDEDENYTARHENSFVQAGDRFYLMGGRENATSIDVYDYTNDSWEELSNITPIVDGVQVEFNHFQATEYQGLIWIIGSFKTNAFPAETPAEYIWMFDPATQEWIQGPEIPAARQRGSAGLVVYNDKFYVVGGNNAGHNNGAVAQFDEYDPATGTWTPLADAPIARDHFAAVVIGDNLYAAGGRQSGVQTYWKPTIPQVDVYNFTTETWSTLPAGQNIPTPRGGASAVNFNNKLVVIGGEVQDEVVYGVETDDALKITEQYDPVTQSWERLVDMNYERHGTQAIVSGPGIHILAGAPIRGGGGPTGVQHNMEYLGEDSPVGVPSVASVLSAPNTLVIADGETIDLDLNVIDGNVGIFIKSMEISGADAADFNIETGGLTNALLNPGSTQTLSISLAGTGENRTAILTINYGESSTLSIALTNNPDATFAVTNPGDQYNYEGDVVSLQIEATSPNVTSYSAIGLPPDLTLNPNTGVISGTIDDGFVGNGSGAFQEDGGLLIIEAESGFIDTPGGFDILNENGTTYLVPTTDHFNDTNGEVVSYDFDITEPGVYRFHMKSDFTGTDPTEFNDVWFKIDNSADVHYFTVQGGDLTSTAEFENILGGGASSKTIYYPEGNAEGRPDFGSENPGDNGYFKIYRSGSGGNKWDGQTIDNNSFPVYAYFTNAGSYSIEVSERSIGHKLDRFALAHIDLVSPGEPTTTLDGPESQQGGGTQVGPGAADNSPYNVSVTVTDNGDPAGNETIDFVWYVGQSGDLIAVPQADVTTGIVPLTVNFTGSNSLDDVGVTAYTWDFMDGSPTTDVADPTHEFTEIGVYEVALTVEDIDGNMDTKSITINVTGTGIAPVAVASSDVSEGDFPLDVVFTGSASTDDLAIESYSWDFGDGVGTSSEVDPTYTYTTVGIYTAILTVTDIEGLTATDEVSITVLQPNAAPVAAVSADQEYGDAPLVVSFVGSDSTDDVGIVTYAWDFGGGNTSTEADPTYIFNVSGEYTVVLTVTDGGGLTDTAEILISVSNQAPVAVATATPETGEAPLEVSFMGSNSTDNGTIVSYAWDFGDGVGTSTEANPTYTFNDSGNYTTVLTVTDNEGETDTANVLIQVADVGGNLAPVAIATATPETGEAPLEVSFMGSNSTDDGTIVSYNWDFGDGNTSSIADPTHTYGETGNFTAILTVTDDEGLSSTANVAIQVTEAGGNQAPIAIAAANPTQGDAPLPVMFDASGSTDDVGIVSYFWDFGDGRTSTVENPVLTFESAGTFEVTLTVTDEGGLTGTDTVTIVVGAVNPEAPIAVITATPESGDAPLEVAFTGSNSTDDVAVVSYAWDFGDGNSSNEADPTHTYNEAGVYNVELTVTDADGLTDTETITIEVLEEETDDIVGVIAPNPAPDVDGFANIQLSQMSSNTVLTYIYLHDSTGRLVGTFNAEQSYDVITDAYRVPVFSLRNGLYFVTIERENGDPIELKLLVNN